MNMQENPLDFSGELLTYAMALSKCSYTAEDLLQETLMRANSAIRRGKYKEGSNLRAWLYRIMRNTHINLWRRAQRRDRIYTSLASEAKTAYDGRLSDDVEFKEMLKGLREAIPMDTHFNVLILALVHEYEYHDISKELGIPIGTVMSSLYRARKRAQWYLKGESMNSFGKRTE